MRQSLAALIAFSLAALFFAPTPIEAQCAFNAPTKAKGIKADMVRAMVPCGGVTLPAPNSATMAGTPTCAPPTARSAYRFGSKGSCKLQMKPESIAKCTATCGFPCSNYSVRVSCSGLEDAGGATVTEGSPNWSLRTVLRVSINDSDGGDMTIIDFPSGFVFPHARNGKIKIATNLFSLPVIFDQCATQNLPPCSSVELLSMKVVDPAGEIFATMGVSTRP